MRISRHFLYAVLMSFPAPAIAGANPLSLFGTSAGSYDGAEPQAVEFKLEGESRAGRSLIGSTFEWARDQGSNIPGLTASQRMAACGPIAAEALVRFFANAPHLDRIVEIFNYARHNDLWNGAMRGPEAERKLLAQYNIQVDQVLWISDLASGERQVRESLERGKPVIISTNRHYFVAQGYYNGRFFVGHTGNIVAQYGGSAQMTLSQIKSAGNGGLALLIPR